MSLSTNGAMALAAAPGAHKLLHVQKLSLQRIDVHVGHPKAVRACDCGITISPHSYTRSRS
jgi:hypothetical protein